MRLDENSGIPLYYQLKELLKAKVDSGELKPGDKLPNEVEIAREWGLSRSTVRRAILDLVQQGLFYRKQGKGTFVAEPKIRGDVVHFFLPAEVGEEHRTVDRKIISPPPSVAEPLGLSPQDQVTELVRVRLANGEPVVIEKSYIPLSICPDLVARDFPGKLYDLLKQGYGISLDEAETYVEPVVLDSFEAELLGVRRGMPALLLTRINFQKDGKPVVLTKSVVRGDRCKLMVHTST
ncbi:MAG TPA: GntR family transcriptional regulator [Firmicutes bacterium]|nr:GntR family transcriptional regulator [Bacillota bacterium]